MLAQVNMNVCMCLLEYVRKKWMGEERKEMISRICYFILLVSHTLRSEKIKSKDS